MKKGLKIFLVILVVLVIAFIAGPKVPEPEYGENLPIPVESPEMAEKILFGMDEEAGEIRPGNESRIYWMDDSLKNKTEYCLLYLHGYSASPMEGDPVHVNYAKYFGMNAIIPRLAEHGLITDEPLLNMTPEVLWKSAMKSLQLAKAMGEKVILMGASTGGSLALKLAAEFPEDIAGLILYSPNIRLYNPATAVLTLPWGLQLGRLISGGKYRYAESDPETDPYWYVKQRVEGPVNLQKLVKTTMKEELFERVKIPTFVGYYYKDEENQDNTVRVDKILWMIDKLGTEENLKRAVAFPEAGAHVICCHLTSDSWEDVLKESLDFSEEVLNLKPLEQTK